MKNISREKIREIVFLAGVFLFIFLWAVTAPFDASPDESMRFQITEYIMKYGNLPDGRDPLIRNANWGISYAFNPITTYIIGAVFGKIAGWFTDSFSAMIVAIRMVNVIFGTLTAFLTLKIGKRLFDTEAARFFFAALVCFLPGSVFIHSYINMDSIAVFSTAWILYVWVRAAKESWSGKLCVQLAAALAVCALSYYNAYGYLLCSALFFVGMMMKCQEKQWDYSQMLKKGFLILGIVVLLAGWWFIRNAMLYDGDILGMRTSSEFSERYAIESLKPSNRQTPQEQGMSLWDMMLWVPGAWEHNWLITVAVSFIGTFGHMDIFMPYTWSKVYLAVLFLGIFGTVLCWKTYFGMFRQKVSKEKVKDAEGTDIIITYRKEKRWDTKKWLHICMLAAAVIPCILLLYYAYASDFQAQGRYLMPSLIPLMYFVALGYDGWVKRLVKRENVRTWIFGIATSAVIVSAVLVYLLVYKAAY